MKGCQKNRPSCGMTSDFRSICGIGPVVGISLVVGPTLVLHIYSLLDKMVFLTAKTVSSLCYYRTRTAGKIIHVCCSLCIRLTNALSNRNAHFHSHQSLSFIAKISTVLRRRDLSAMKKRNLNFFNDELLLFSGKL